MKTLLQAMRQRYFGDGITDGRYTITAGSMERTVQGYTATVGCFNVYDSQDGTTTPVPADNYETYWLDALRAKLGRAAYRKTWEVVKVEAGK